MRRMETTRIAITMCAALAGQVAVWASEFLPADHAVLVARSKGEGSSRSVALSGSHAYVVELLESSPSRGALRVVNVTNPGSPTDAALLELPGDYGSPDRSRIAVAGSYAYVAAGSAGLRVLDVSDPVAPREAGDVNWPAFNSFNAVTVSGSYAYVLDVNFRAFRIVDISDPSAPQRLGSREFRYGHWDIAVFGSYAYLSTDGLILDVSQPFAIYDVGAIGSAIAIAIASSGSHAYALTDLSRLAVHDLADPARPVRVGSCDLGFSGLTSVAVSGSVVYVVAGGAGVFILDVSDPEAPRLVGSYPIPLAHDVAVDENYAYVAAAEEGLYVLALDSDGDGVGNPVDSCPESIATPTVVFGDCDTDVPNMVAPDGCNVTDRILACDDGSGDHGRFVSCVSRVTNELGTGGLLPQGEHGRLQRCAAKYAGMETR